MFRLAVSAETLIAVSICHLTLNIASHIHSRNPFATCDVNGTQNLKLMGRNITVDF